LGEFGRSVRRRRAARGPGGAQIRAAAMSFQQARGGRPAPIVDSPPVMITMSPAKAPVLG